MFEIEQKCCYCSESKMIISRVLDSINRVTYRYYCTICRMCSGALVRESTAKQIASIGGYQIETITPKTHEDYSYEKFMKNDILPLVYQATCDVTDIHDLCIGYETMPSGHVSHILFCASCGNRLVYLPDYAIKKWSEYKEYPEIGISECMALKLLQMTHKIKSITPFHPESLAHKIPRHLLDDYQEYLKSDKWKRKRNIRHALDNGQCVLCFTNHNLQTHHVTYDTLFDEETKHLMTVCKSCHETIHGRTFDK